MYSLGVKRFIYRLSPLLLVYFAILVVLFLVQDKLIFFPQRITEEYAGGLAKSYPDVEEIKIITEDQVTLHGWFVKNKTSNKSPLIIYFGGNAEEVSYMIGNANQFSGYSLLLMNYRGYGLSEGSPNEIILCRDADLIYEEMVKRGEIDKEKIIVMGRSIGSGLAVHIADKKKVCGVVLITPYDSLVSVAQKKIRIAPVSLILRNRFESIRKAPTIKVPLLVLAARNDQVIPPCHTENLAEQWGGKVDIKILDGADHNTIQYADQYWETIQKFLREI